MYHSNAQGWQIGCNGVRGGWRNRDKALSRIFGQDVAIGRMVEAQIVRRKMRGAPQLQGREKACFKVDQTRRLWWRAEHAWYGWHPERRMQPRPVSPDGCCMYEQHESQSISTFAEEAESRCKKLRSRTTRRVRVVIVAVVILSRETDFVDSEFFSILVFFIVAYQPFLSLAFKPSFLHLPAPQFLFVTCILAI